MKITIQSIRFDADIKLLNFIQKKSNKLDQYFDQIVSGAVYLKLAKVEDEANKICEIKLSVRLNDQSEFRTCAKIASFL